LSIRQHKTMSKHAFQYGSGLHIDSNLHSMWKKETFNAETGSYVQEPLDRFRPFQSFVALTDQTKGDSTLEVIPGFYQYAERYYSFVGRRAKKSFAAGPYNTKLTKTSDKQLLSHVSSQVIHRIPENWTASVYEDRFTIESINMLINALPKENSRSIFADMEYESARALNMEAVTHLIELNNQHNPTEEISKLISDICNSPSFNLKLSDLFVKAASISNEHKKMGLKGNEMKAGDFVLWDIRQPHQNGEFNDTDTPRQVFYHAYLVANETINGKLIKHINECRKTGKHINDFSKKFSFIEEGKSPAPLDDFGKLLYGEKAWSNWEATNFQSVNLKDRLTRRHIDYFKRYGYVVVENVIDQKLVMDLTDTVNSKLIENGVNVAEVKDVMSGRIWKNFTKISNPFGGMLEYFWLPQQEAIRMDPTPYNITVKLMQHTWCSKDKRFMHPFNPQIEDEDEEEYETGIVPEFLWLYNDRLNFRFPSKWKPTEVAPKSPKKRKIKDSVDAPKKKQSKLFAKALSQTKEHFTKLKNPLK
jgi:hypothetical protein